MDPLSPMFKQMELERSPPSAAPMAVQPTTAEDLLNNVMGITRSPPVPQHGRVASVPPVNLLFGSGALGNSIWSPSADNSAPTYARNNLSLANGRSYPSQPSQPLAPSLPLTQSSLASSQSWQPLPSNPTMVPSYVNGPLSGPFVQQQTYGASHQRIPSKPLHSFRSGMSPPLPSQPLYESSLHANVYGTGMINEPMDVSNAGLVGRSATHGFTGGYSSPPASNNFYQQSQPDMFAIGHPSNHIQHEQDFHSPFQTSSISNIWGAPG